MVLCKWWHVTSDGRQWKTYGSHLVFFGIIFLEGSQPLCHENTPATLYKITHGEELLLPANSQLQLASDWMSHLGIRSSLFCISSQHPLFLLIWRPELQPPLLSWCKPHTDYFFNIHFFIWSCSMWNLRLRIKRAAPALEVWSPHQWTAREAPLLWFFLY